MSTNPTPLQRILNSHALFIKENFIKRCQTESPKPTEASCEKQFSRLQQQERARNWAIHQGMVQHAISYDYNPPGYDIREGNHDYNRLLEGIRKPANNFKFGSLLSHTLGTDPLQMNQPQKYNLSNLPQSNKNVLSNAQLIAEIGKYTGLSRTPPNHVGGTKKKRKRRRKKTARR
jgi:hypothetical protein